MTGFMLMASAQAKPGEVASRVTKAEAAKPDIPLTKAQDAQLTRWQVLMQDRGEQLAKAQVLLEAAQKAFQETQQQAQSWTQGLVADHPGYRLDEAARVLTAKPAPKAGER